MHSEINKDLLYIFQKINTFEIAVIVFITMSLSVNILKAALIPLRITYKFIILSLSVYPLGSTFRL